MLRAARESRGLHIAALAASIKISPRKLDALECDRLDELPDATFARALAQTVCRALKIDSQPVLARMPAVESAVSTLEPQRAGLNAPFEDGTGRSGSAIRRSQKVLVWAGAVLVACAAALLLLPAGTFQALLASSTMTAQPGGAPDPASSGAASSAAAAEAMPMATPGSDSGATPAAPAASGPAGASSVNSLAANPPLSEGGGKATAAGPDKGAAPAVETVYSAPALSAAASADPVPMLQLAVSEPSWVEVQEKGARVLLSRTLVPGETVKLSGEVPLKLRIGNASATRLEFRGREVDLRPMARSNVVSELELK